MDAFIAAADRHFGQSLRLDRERELGATCINGAACCFCIQLVSFALSVPLREIRKSSRGVAEVALARQIAMYLAHTKLSISQAEVGLHFGRDKSTVTHACQLVETKRDEVAFDEMVIRLETMLDAMQAVSFEIECSGSQAGDRDHNDGAHR